MILGWNCEGELGKKNMKKITMKERKEKKRNRMMISPSFLVFRIADFRFFLFFFFFISFLPYSCPSCCTFFILCVVFFFRWGIENVEMALKTWLCGGKVLASSCSHFGHMFKVGFTAEYVRLNFTWERDI